MDTFENNSFPEQDPIPAQPASPEPQQAPYTPPQQPPYSAPYSGTGTGRKESPYANSPYEAPRPQPEYHYQPQPPRPAEKKPAGKKKGWKRVLSALLVLALIAGGCGITAAAVNSRWEEKTQAMIQDFDNRFDTLQSQLEEQALQAPGSYGPSIPADGSTMNPAQLYASRVNSVVAISTTVQAMDFYGISEGTSSGSGFIFSQDGYVITNSHVVDGATSVEVILHDGTSYPAEIVGQDASNDIAVLKVEAEGLIPAPIGSSSAMSIGDIVVAIGNPLGELSSTQTVGYVSGINREVSTDNSIISMIQTDAAINPGNSGGPLFNMYGQVIGITTAKYSGTTGSGASIEGIGFAIPIDDIYTMLTDLIDFGYVTGAYLGVTVQNTDPEAAAMFGLPVGASVVTVEAGSSADRAGVRPKDIIIDLGGHTVSSITDLTRALRNFRAGDTTTVTVIRSGAEVTLTITLDEKPQPAAQTPEIPQDDENLPSSGDFQEWYDYFRRYFG